MGRKAEKARSEGRETRIAGAGPGKLALKGCGCETVTIPLDASSDFSSSSWLP